MKIAREAINFFKTPPLSIEYKPGENIKKKVTHMIA
jgi:hypothetical protein